MQNINYSAGLPTLPIIGASAINLDTWISDLKGNFDSIMKRLFANNEQGIYLDPNDLTEEKLNWRKNLCTESEFRNGLLDAPSRGGNILATTFAGLADGTGIQLNHDAAVSAYTYKQVPTVIGQVYNFSCYIRMLDGTRPRVGVGTTSANDCTLVFDTTIVPVDRLTIEQVSGSLYRVSGYGTATRLFASVGVVKYIGQSVRPVIVSGYQCEIGTLVSPYQRITDFNAEFLKAFPKHTLFQDTVGAVPITALGSTVGVILDRSKNLILGAELIPQPVNMNNWNKTAAVTANTSNSFTTSGAGGCTLPVFGALNTKMHKLYLKGHSTTAGVLRSGGAGSTGTPIPSGHFEITANDPLIGGYSSSIYIALSGAGTITLDEVSVRELTGNHAYQPTSAKRAILSARVNRFSDDKNIPWQEASFTGVGTQRYIQKAIATAPDGTQTADRVVVSNGTNGLQRIFVPVGLGGVPDLLLTYSIYAKANVGSKIALQTSTGSYTASIFDLVNGKWLTDGNAINRTATYIKDGWWRLSITFVHPATTSVVPWVIIPHPTNNGLTWVGDGVTDVMIWGGQLEYGEYVSKFQWIKSATDYDTKDFSRYFETDGVDDLFQISPFALPSPYSLMVCVKSLRTTSATVPLFSGRASGYLYQSALYTFGVQQNTNDPQVFLSKNSVDVITQKTDSNGAFFKSNKIESLRTDLVAKNPYASSNYKFIGSFDDASTATVNGQIYGILAIGRSINDAEEKAIRDEFNKRISYV